MNDSIKERLQENKKLEGNQTSKNIIEK